MSTNVSRPDAGGSRFATSLTMGASLHLAIDPIHDTQAIFRTTLDAMSWPGSVRQIPVSARDAPGNPWVAALLITLVDHETTLAVMPGVESEAIETFVRQRTSVLGATPADAAFVLAEVSALDPELPLQTRRGSLEYPDDGATIVIWTAASIDCGLSQRLRLAGPGVPERLETRVPRMPAGFFDARAEAVGAYPSGIDILFVDGDGRLIALPRSTSVTVMTDEGKGV